MGSGGSKKIQVRAAPTTVPIAPQPLQKPIVMKSTPSAAERNLDCLDSGYVKIHSGLRLSKNDEAYSSPLLVINLYKDEDTPSQTEFFGGTAIHANESVHDVDIKTVTKVQEKYINCTEELKIIPVEDIISIRYTSRFRKAVYHEERIDKAEEMEIKRGIFRDTKIKKEVAHTTVKDTQDAKRLITIEIEYYKYANPDSASILRGLSKEQRESHVKSLIEKSTLKFNLINNKDFDSGDFKEKQHQAELLCRAVAHLKTLRVYPSIEPLANMLRQESLETLGHPFVERSLGGTVPAITNTQADRQLAIEIK